MQAGCQKTEILKNGCGMEIFQRAGAGFAHFDRPWCRIVVNLRRAVRGIKRKSQPVTGVLRRNAPPSFKPLRWPLALLKLFQHLLSFINPRIQRMTFSLDCISWPLTQKYIYILLFVKFTEVWKVKSFKTFGSFGFLSEGRNGCWSILLGIWNVYNW